MRFALDFPDSEALGVTADDGVVRVRLSAAAVRDADGVRGWLPGVALTLHGAVVAGDVSQAFGRIAEGRLRHDGRDVVRPALPDSLAGDLELTLRFANGTSVSARGRALVSSVADGARFREDLSC